MSAAMSDALEMTGEESNALVESTTDAGDAAMAHDESSRIPSWVLLVWLCSIAGFIAFLAICLFPQLVT
jgi:hypothetical protein